MDEKSVAKDFPIICVGGSAGGLDAYTRLLQNLPSDMGVAIVIVNHLRTVATLLHEKRSMQLGSGKAFRKLLPTGEDDPVRSTR